MSDNVYCNDDSGSNSGVKFLLSVVFDTVVTENSCEFRFDEIE